MLAYTRFTRPNGSICKSCQSSATRQKWCSGPEKKFVVQSELYRTEVAWEREEGRKDVYGRGYEIPGEVDDVCAYTLSQVH